MPTLTTARLMLRPLRPADAPDLFVLRADPQVMRFIPRPLAQTVADAEEYIVQSNERMAEGQLLNWGLTLRSDDRVIGTIGYFRLKPEHFRAEIGYLLHPGHHGTGLMQEAVAAVLDYGFGTMNLHSVEAVVDPENAASIRLLERNRFVREGHFRQNEFFDGKFLDTAYYSLLHPAAR
ncbi:GNAT family N-acetyltransferase [Hymenobacter daecheongensis]|uniref:GNAT family N-acetyltransferase n=1 Tax=Hymenobacter daecheongensis TaxID=496053 RepID=UPI00190E6B09|nr:GNAT family N-acetyltransferase [Hymenobacter daecheongensis]